MMKKILLLILKRLGYDIKTTDKRFSKKDFTNSTLTPEKTVHLIMTVTNGSRPKAIKKSLTRPGY